MIHLVYKLSKSLEELVEEVNTNDGKGKSGAENYERTLPYERERISENLKWRYEKVQTLRGMSRNSYTMRFQLQ